MSEQSESRKQRTRNRELYGMATDWLTSDWKHDGYWPDLETENALNNSKMIYISDKYSCEVIVANVNSVSS